MTGTQSPAITWPILVNNSNCINRGRCGHLSYGYGRRFESFTTRHSSRRQTPWPRECATREAKRLHGAVSTWHRVLCARTDARPVVFELLDLLPQRGLGNVALFGG